MPPDAPQPGFGGPFFDGGMHHVIGFRGGFFLAFLVNRSRPVVVIVVARDRSATKFLPDSSDRTGHQFVGGGLASSGPVGFPASRIVVYLLRGTSTVKPLTSLYDVRTVRRTASRFAAFRDERQPYGQCVQRPPPESRSRCPVGLSSYVCTELRRTD